MGIESSECRLCASRSLAFLYPVSQCSVDQCRVCGFVQVRNPPSENEVAGHYSEPYFDRGKYDDLVAQEREYRKRLSLLEEVGLSRSAHVLDAGCATGDFIAFVGDRYDMWGLDVSPFAVKVAKSKAAPGRATQIRSGFIENCDFEPQFFDAIVMWDVVEHIRNPVETCRRLLDYLRPGGFLFLSTPDIGATTARLMGRRWAFMTPPEHLCFFNHDSMTWMLKKHLGLEPLRLFSTGKWVNVSFLLYKLRRVMPRVMPEFVVSGFRGTALGRTNVYVPTRDIQYAVARKPSTGSEQGTV